MESVVEVIVGTYEEFILGYTLKQSDSEYSLSQSFATHAHTGSVRSVSTGGRFLASGGADDKVTIHDLKTRTSIRVMMHHNGTVNCVAFSHSGSHLFTGSSDGSMTATRAGNWQMEKYWKKAHNGDAVQHIAIHPSDKLALTIGDDHVLRTWNLIKGRHAYATNLASKGVANATATVWSPKGKQFALVGLNHIGIWTVSDAGVKKLLQCSAKCVCLTWISENVIAAGLESGDIQLFYFKTDKDKIFKAHDQRIKAIAYNDNRIYSASSSGHIKVWDYKKSSLKELCVVSTGCRITCLALNKLCEKINVECCNEAESTTQKRKLDVKNQKPYVSVSLNEDTHEQNNVLEPCVDSSFTDKHKKKKKN